jgi:hypothetical protein
MYAMRLMLDAVFKCSLSCAAPLIRHAEISRCRAFIRRAHLLVSSQHGLDATFDAHSVAISLTGASAEARRSSDTADHSERTL